MNMVNAHQWERVESYGNGSQDRCAVCKITRFYSWAPGWPGYYTYYRADGTAIAVAPWASPPDCAAYPVDGLFAQLMAP